MVNFILGLLSFLAASLPTIYQAAFAPGTYKNLCTQWSTYMGFASHCGFPWSEPTDAQLSAYAVYLSFYFKAPATIKNYMSGIKTLFLLNDLPVNVFDSVRIRLALRGLARLKQHCPRQAAPITPDILMAIHGFLDLSRPNNKALWALCLVAFFTMSRRSNLLCPKESCASGHFAMRKNVSHSGDALVILFSSSKTNPLGNRQHVVPLAPIPGSKLCPVAAVLDMCAAIPAEPKSPLFMRLKHGNVAVPITYSYFSSFLRVALTATGYEPKHFSSHSFRRGGATWAFKCGVPGELIKITGDWRSNCYLRYLDFSLDQKVLVSACMSQTLKGR